MSHSAFRVAIVTVPPVFLDLKASIERACSLIAEAASQGAKLIAFGESWLPGYPFWIWLRSVPDGMPLTTRLYQNSLVLDSIETQRLRQAAREHDIYVVMGAQERRGGSIYNALLFIDNTGEIPLVRHKLMPAGAERIVWGQGSGADLQVIKTKHVGGLSGQMCWEHIMPGLDAIFCAQGEEVHVAAWPNFAVKLDYSVCCAAASSLSQAYALRTQSFVICAAHVASDEIRDMVCVTERDREVFVHGGGFAQIYAPNGQPLIDFKDDRDARLYYGEIDLEQVSIAKMLCDNAGHYTRPDVIKVHANRAPAPSVHFHGKPNAGAAPFGPQGEQAPGSTESAVGHERN